MRLVGWGYAASQYGLSSKSLLRFSLIQNKESSLKFVSFLRKEVKIIVVTGVMSDSH